MRPAIALFSFADSASTYNYKETPIHHALLYQLSPLLSTVIFHKFFRHIYYNYTNFGISIQNRCRGRKRLGNATRQPLPSLSKTRLQGIRSFLSEHQKKEPPQVIPMRAYNKTQKAFERGGEPSFKESSPKKILPKLSHSSKTVSTTLGDAGGE